MVAAIHPLDCTRVYVAILISGVVFLGLNTLRKLIHISCHCERTVQGGASSAGGHDSREKERPGTARETGLGHAGGRVPKVGALGDAGHSYRGCPKRQASQSCNSESMSYRLLRRFVQAWDGDLIRVSAGIKCSLIFFRGRA